MELENFKKVNSLRYNAAVINQSLEFVCCSNIETLQESIQLYNEYKNKDTEFMLAEDAFKTE